MNGRYANESLVLASSDAITGQASSSRHCATTPAARLSRWRETEAAAVAELAQAANIARGLGRAGAL